MRAVLIFIAVAAAAFELKAWCEGWAPDLECVPAKVRMLSATAVSNYYCRAGIEIDSMEYSQGAALDLNGDGFYDFVYIFPWMGCGLNADGCEVIFRVSNGTNGMVETEMEGYGARMSDLVKVAGRVYFRHSMFFGPFEKSAHNHWVSQMFSFETNGMVKCANADFCRKFPAVTVYYDDPKFRQIDLTSADLKKIDTDTRPKRRKSVGCFVNKGKGGE